MKDGAFKNPRGLDRQKGWCRSLKLCFQNSLLFCLVSYILLFLCSSAASAQGSYGDIEKEGGAFSILSNPPDVSIVLEGEDLIVGETPFSISELREGSYKVSLSKSGYESQVGYLTVFRNREHVLTGEFSPVSKRDVLLRSTLLPGWGQFYSGNKTKGVVFGVLQTAAIAGALLTNAQYQGTLDDLDASVERYNSATNVADIRQFREERDRRYEDADKAYDRRRVALGFVSGIWLSNVLDAALLLSELKADTDAAGSVTFHLIPKTRFRAMLRSTLLPGWGQFYSGRKRTGILYGLSGLSSIAAVILANSNYQSTVDDLERARERYLSSTAVEDIERYRQEMDACSEDADRAFGYRQLSLGLLVSIWVYNVLDSVVTFEQSSPLGQQASSGKKSSIYALVADETILLGINYQF